MRGVARLGDKCHGICYHSSHKTPPVVSGVIITASTTATEEGRGIARIGDRVRTDCGHEGVIITSSTINFIDDRGVARLGDRVSDVYDAVIISASTVAYTE